MMALLTREEVHARLQVIFPDGSPNRAYLTRMLAASTVFVALYVNAIEGSGTHLGPSAYFSSEVSRGLNVLAAENGTTLQALLGEAIDFLMRQYGKHPFGEREVRKRPGSGHLPIHLNQRRERAGETADGPSCPPLGLGTLSAREASPKPRTSMTVTRQQSFKCSKLAHPIGRSLNTRPASFAIGWSFVQSQNR